MYMLQPEIVRPHPVHRVHRCLAIDTDVTHNVVCVCVFITRMCYAKTAEPIKMPFGGWLMWVQRTMY